MSVTRLSPLQTKSAPLVVGQRGQRKSPARWRGECKEKPRAGRGSLGLRTRIIGPVETNANGSYVRLENGLQICWHLLPQAVSNFATGPLYKTAPAPSWNYPQPFIDQPVRLAGVRWVSGSVLGVELSGASGTATGYAVVGTTSTSTGIPMLCAIGRWK